MRASVLPSCPSRAPRPIPAHSKSTPTTLRLPASEAFRIEYWALEEAKIRRQPAAKELSGRIVLVVGGASGIGREVVLMAAERGAHVVVADRELDAADKVAAEAQAIAGREGAIATKIDIRDRAAIRSALDATIAAYGGIDILVNTAALFPSSPDGTISDAQWASTLEINVTANYLLADEAAKVFDAQGIETSIVLTSSANAVVAKRGSEAYDVSKAARQPPGSRTRGHLVPQGSRQRHQSRHGGEGFHHVSSRPGESVADKIQHPLRRVLLR